MSACQLGRQGAGRERHGGWAARGLFPSTGQNGLQTGTEGLLGRGVGRQAQEAGFRGPGHSSRGDGVRRLLPREDRRGSWQVYRGPWEGAEAAHQPGPSPATSAAAAAASTTAALAPRVRSSRHHEEQNHRNDVHPVFGKEGLLLLGVLGFLRLLHL